MTRPHPEQGIQSPARSKKGGTLRIGWAEIDTTPEEPVDLAGQYYHRVSRGIHSRLSATALAIESEDGGQVVMVSLDLVGIPSDFQDDARALVRDALPELDPQHLFFNATHTHNAPRLDWIVGKGWLQELPDVLSAATYRAFLLERVKDVVIAAWHERAPGGIAATLGFARAGHCRRAVYDNGTAEMYGDTGRPDFIGMESGEDSGVDMLFTFEANDQPSGMILNLACPSQVMEATYQVSADFIGETRRLLKERFGNHFKVLGQISAAGCQSPRDLTRNYKGEPDFWQEDGVAELGRRLFVSVTAALPRASRDIQRVALLKHQVKHIELPVRRASQTDYQNARKELDSLTARISEDAAHEDFCAEVARNEKIPGRPGPYDSKNHSFVLIQNAKAVVARYEQQDAKPSFAMELHFLRMGDVAFTTNPFELYLDFGHQIKARSPAAQTFIVQLCSGKGGYLPSARAEALGGYGGLIINGKVGSEGGKQLVDICIREMKRLWS